MKALVFNPYMPALGGGERYMLGLAAALRCRYDVEIAAPVVPPADALTRLGFEVDGPIRRMTVGQFTRASAAYDLTAQITNHLPLYSRAAQSLVMVQFPFRPYDWKHPLRHRHGRRTAGETYITNSEFSRSFCRPRWGVEATVIHPPVELNPDRPDTGPKGPQIVAVGRFFRGYHAKRFDVLIEAFRALPAPLREDWELVLVGGSSHPTSADVLRELRQLARGLNVRIVVDAHQDELRHLYRRSTLLWQATGYGRRPDRPEHAEHFGITLVEAMSYGCVPLVFADGGAPEILGPLGSSCLWSTTDDLVARTCSLVADRRAQESLAAEAVERSERYSRADFGRRVTDLLGSLGGR